MAMMSCSAMAHPQNAKIVYPGVWTDKEKDYIEALLKENEAVNNRGEIDLEALKSGALPEDTPGFAAKWTVTEEYAKSRAALYDVNPLYFEKAYAMKAGYKDIICYPSIGCRDDSFFHAVDKAAMDGFAPTDLNHTNKFLRPVYPGDTLYYIVDKHYFTDVTPPEGATFRAVALNNEGRVINQNGEAVAEVIYRVVENLKFFVDPDGEKPFDEGHNARRDTGVPQLPYDDEDWEGIFAQWRSEVKRGGEYLFWDDVSIGDAATPTLLGPNFKNPGPGTDLCGMGGGGVRPLKEELLDESILKTLSRDEDGLYKLPDWDANLPPADPMGPPGAGGANFNSRDTAIRHITDWCGDHGWLKEISWGGLMIPDSMVSSWPMNPYRISMPDPADYPGEKSQITNKNRKWGCNRVKSWITKKYFEDGEYLVNLSWFIEDYNGNPGTSGTAVVRLPKKEKEK